MVVINLYPLIARVAFKHLPRPSVRSTVTISPTNETPTMEMYLLKFSNKDAMLPMNGARLTRLLDKMPTLRYLLFGHPSMQKKKLQEQDGAKVLELPSFLDIEKDSFVQLLHVIEELEPIPASCYKKFSTMIKTLTNLGGCEELEQRMRKKYATNPQCPDEDFQQLFEWKAANITEGNSLTLVDSDLEVTASFYSESATTSTYYLRKRKAPAENDEE